MEDVLISAIVALKATIVVKKATLCQFLSFYVVWPKRMADYLRLKLVRMSLKFGVADGARTHDNRNHNPD